MKKIVCAAAVLALAACNQEAAEAPAADETVAAAPEAATAETAALAIDGKPSAGKYKITDADGATYDYEVKADGTFSATASNGETMAGTWNEPEPGKYCETVDGTETCYTEEMKDGVWTSTGPDGKVSTIVRVEA
ncbi:hypothetical protein [Tsuneonella sp. HG222]